MIPLQYSISVGTGGRDGGASSVSSKEVSPALTSLCVVPTYLEYIFLPSSSTGEELISTTADRRAGGRGILQNLAS